MGTPSGLPTDEVLRRVALVADELDAHGDKDDAVAIRTLLATSPAGGLREALEPFAEAARACDDNSHTALPNNYRVSFTLGQCRQARAALSSSPTVSSNEDAEWLRRYASECESKSTEARLNRIANTLKASPTIVGGEEMVERVAKAICEASGETWRVGTTEAATGANFEMEEHPLDPCNNHWRHKARAVLAALCDEGVKRGQRLSP